MQARIDAQPRAARIHGADELEARGEGGAARGAGDDDSPLLQRLAQGLENALGELRQLVQEEDAVVREADLARPRDAAAADQARVGDGVMRRAERPLGDEPAVGGQEPARRCRSWRPRAPRRGSAAAGCPARRRASMVLPEPGGPSMSTLCAPAAATSSARLTCSWPRTSAKSTASAAGAISHRPAVERGMAARAPRSGSPPRPGASRRVRREARRPRRPPPHCPRGPPGLEPPRRHDEGDGEHAANRAHRPSSESSPSTSARRAVGLHEAGGGEDAERVGKSRRRLPCGDRRGRGSR